MFAIQIGFSHPCEACSKEQFYQIVKSSKVIEAIKVARNAQAQVDALLAAGYASDDKRVKDYEKAKQIAKNDSLALLFRRHSTRQNLSRAKWADGARMPPQGSTVSSSST